MALKEVRVEEGGLTTGLVAQKEARVEEGGLTTGLVAQKEARVQAATVDGVMTHGRDHQEAKARRDLLTMDGQETDGWDQVRVARVRLLNRNMMMDGVAMTMGQMMTNGVDLEARVASLLHLVTMATMDGVVTMPLLVHQRVVRVVLPVMMEATMKVIVHGVVTALDPTMVLDLMIGQAHQVARVEKVLPRVVGVMMEAMMEEIGRAHQAARVEKVPPQVVGVMMEEIGRARHQAARVEKVPQVDGAMMVETGEARVVRVARVALVLGVTPGLGAAERAEKAALVEAGVDGVSSANSTQDLGVSSSLALFSFDTLSIHLSSHHCQNLSLIAFTGGN
jgi:hypothetical protein